ncbi:MAG: matrixin family metalloprotease [Firmicutes bacterium]|nr:matrixin family metalloprotease [Bacillota bacterium]
MSGGDRRFWRLPLLMVALIACLGLYEWQRRERYAPLTYRIGTVDERFGLSAEEFAEAVEQAAGLWRHAAGREVFRAQGGGMVEMNLIYDYRQEAADRLKALNLKLENSRAAYDTLKSRFESLQQECDSESAQFKRDGEELRERVARFNARRDALAQRGGTDSALRALEEERQSLFSAQEGLRQRQERLSENLETLKSLAVVVNDLAAHHNLDVVAYGDTGRSLGEEFSEGEYVRDGARRTISVYHFPSRNGLVRVLAHEIGHALGIAHLPSQQAVMHRLMKSDTPELTHEDVEALRQALHRK